VLLVVDVLVSVVDVDSVMLVVVVSAVVVSSVVDCEFVVVVTGLLSELLNTDINISQFYSLYLL